MCVNAERTKYQQWRLMKIKQFLQMNQQQQKKNPQKNTFTNSRDEYVLKCHIVGFDSGIFRN